MPLSPYISFAGNQVRRRRPSISRPSAQNSYKITFGEMPKDENSEEGCPSGMNFPDTAIAHSNVRIAGSDIMMSDGLPPGGSTQYAGFTLVLDTQDVDEGETLVRQPLMAAMSKWRQETFWAHGSGKSPINTACRG